MNEEPRIDVYAVGAFDDWKRKRFLYGLKNYVWRQIKRRDWRAVRNYYNGYLAEVSYSDIQHTRCGRGWTKQAALSSLGRQLGRDNPGRR